MIFTYKIEGMHCESCVEKIKFALSAIKIINITFKPPIIQIEAEAVSLNDLNAKLLSVGNYQLKPISTGNKENEKFEENEQGLKAYFPIFLIATYIAGVAFINNYYTQGINWQGWMNQFMAGFFLVFSAFKFLNIRGFAEGYATYDLLAKRWYTYGFIYPFLELGLGILYLRFWFPITTSLLTIIIMGFSSLGVINSLLKKQNLHCACLGTILKVPLSTVTLTEDLLMVVLAIVSLSMR